MTQQPLFPDGKLKPVSPEELDAQIRAIKPLAPGYDPNKEVSEAAQDQGWGNAVTLPSRHVSGSDLPPVDTEVDAVSDEPPVYDPVKKAASKGNHPTARQKRRYPQHESRYGDSEVDGGVEPSGREVYEPLDEDTKALGKLGVALARSMKDKSQKPKGF